MDRQQFLDALLGLVAIDSVAMTDPDAAHPYGTGPARALDYVMRLCGELGIRTENLMLCVKDVKNEFGQFMKFENLTWVPIEIGRASCRERV